MFLREPNRTRYDLNFWVFGIPVRVHPAFLIMPVVLGSSLLRDPEYNAGIILVCLIGIFFVSVLVHELGHALAFRHYGIPSRIVLYWMGGLAIPDSGPSWKPVRRPGLTPNRQIVVSLAGPGMGFLLAALLVALIYGVGGSVIYEQSGIFPLLFADLSDSVLANSPHLRLIYLLVYVSLFANIFINILNLMPVYPLDGGQVLRQILFQVDMVNGLRNSIIVSVIVAVGIAVYSLMTGDRFLAFFFGFMAWSNYTTLQQMNPWGGSRPW